MSDHARIRGRICPNRFSVTDLGGLIPALVALAGLALLDARADWVITGFFAVVLFTTALSGNPRVTAVVAAIAVVIAAVSGTWTTITTPLSSGPGSGLASRASGFSIYDRI